jgi:hypothetical protein
MDLVEYPSMAVILMVSVALAVLPFATVKAIAPAAANANPIFAFLIVIFASPSAAKYFYGLKLHNHILMRKSLSKFHNKVRMVTYRPLPTNLSRSL